MSENTPTIFSTNLTTGFIQWLKDNHNISFEYSVPETDDTTMTHTIGSETYEATKTAAADWEDLIETSAEWDDLSNLEMHEQIEDYIAMGQKINAIKYYRQEMSDQLGEQVTLREAKEYIDKVADDMRLRGIIKR